MAGEDSKEIEEVYAEPMAARLDLDSEVGATSLDMSLFKKTRT